ncbi:MAG: excalibur calcium-binding domain-containing protein, partial [Chloroflexia bacterium]|nr:excalibur calcium-binding domain-containing protein [Chloroflexia bacterium]
MRNPIGAVSRALLALILPVVVAVTGVPVTAQDRFNCPDFASQEEAQEEYDRTAPDDPSGLDRDDDTVACENQFNLTPEEEAAVIAAREPLDGASDPAAEPTSTPASTPIPTPTPTPT